MKISDKIDNVGHKCFLPIVCVCARDARVGYGSSFVDPIEPDP